MANLLAVVTLNCWVVLCPIPLTLEFLHVIEGVILVCIILLPVKIVERFFIVRLLIFIVRSWVIGHGS